MSPNSSGASRDEGVPFRIPEMDGDAIVVAVLTDSCRAVVDAFARYSSVSWARWKS
jgi:hypothetical protein